MEEQAYQSKKEAGYAETLDFRKIAGEISFWLRQVPITLPGGKVYRVDFMTFQQVVNTDLYEIHWIEVKGHKTTTGEVKRSVAEAILGITIEVV